MTTTPAPQPTPPTGDTRPQQHAGATPLTRTQKILTAVVIGAALVIATLGFIGSYAAVTKLAAQKGFGEFATAFPIAVDAGIIAFLALDLLLTWRRIPFPLLRYVAWTLTAATIIFNAAAAWPDKLGSAMHGVIPVLFVIAVEAARHAVGRIADITADKHIESPPVIRWIVAPLSTAYIWRRMRKWHIRSYQQAIEHQKETKVYRAELRRLHGSIRKAPQDKRLVLTLTAYGMSVAEAIDRPAKEAAARKALEHRAELERRAAEDNQQRELEAARIESERDALEQRLAEEEATRQRQVAEAETRSRLAEIRRAEEQAAEDAARRQKEAEQEAARLHLERQATYAQQVADAEERARQAAEARRAAEAAAREEAEKKEAAARRAVEVMAAAKTASSTPASASQTASAAAANGPANPASASVAATSRPASKVTARIASDTPASASATSASTPTANAGSASASAVDVDQVVATYDLLAEQDGKAPSDAKLGAALGVSRSRAQQLRTLAIDAGHTRLAKPLRVA